MPNPNYSKMTSAGKGALNKAMGSPPSEAMNEKTANWPGLPGKGSPDRSAGVKQSGSMGPFRHKKAGI